MNNQEIYRGFQISKPRILTDGTYRVYITRLDNSLVVTGEGETPDEAIIDAKDNLDYFLTN